MYGGPAAYGESMTKKDLGGKNCLYPMPVFLVGAEVEGVVDFTTVAHVGILNVGEVNYVSIGLGKGHHVNRGIKANREFSLCLPSEDMMVAVDHCGIASGAKVDKSKVFKVARGKLSFAPMAEECPICMECRLHDTLDYGSHDIFIGAIAASYAEEAVLSSGAVDLAKVHPLLFEMFTRSYWKLGERAGSAWSEGRRYR
ncbi:MAG: flavin reductase family protein [Methanomassiliicoccales archaeon]